MNNEERNVRNSINKFELEGNVGNIGEIYVNKNDKQILRFDLCQNNNGNAQFIPIVLKGELINSYGKEIKKGDWLSIKGKILSYSKDLEKDGKTYKDKVVEILGFEITDRKNNKVYSADGQVRDLKVKEEIER